MVSNRCDAVTPFKRVTQNAAGGPGTGYRHQVIAIMAVQEFSQGALGYTGFNRDNAHFGIKLGNSVEPAEVKDDAVILNRVGTAIAPVIAGTHRINRDTPSLRHLQNRRDLFLVSGAEYRRNSAFCPCRGCAKLRCTRRDDSGFIQNGGPFGKCRCYGGAIHWRSHDI